jgi:tetratricopeptide (TPR) repeat protein
LPRDDIELGRLLRALNDPRALRRSALARALAGPGDDARFVDAIQALVRAALPAGSRAALIVERSDIEGVPHKAVAAELGLSLRHFYRERRRARELLRDALLIAPPGASEHDRRDALIDEVELQHALIDFGHGRAAAGVAARLLESGVPDELRTTVLALRARALVEDGRDGAGFERFDRSEGDGTLTPSELAEIACARACRADAAGRGSESAEHARRAVALTETESRSTPRRRRAHARMLACLANTLQADNDPAGALDAFERARDVLQGCGSEPVAQRTRILIDLAVTRFSLAPMIEQGLVEARHALRSAAWHGLPAEREWAEIAVALGTFAMPSEARLHELRVPCVQGLGSSGQWLARMHLLVSRMHTARGEVAAALEAVREARTHIPPRHYLHATADLREAEALIAEGDARAALPLATRAIDRISVGASSHYSGAAHLAAAEALMRLGRNVPARAHCEAGVASLRRGAFVREVARGLRLAARLTGEARYLREERELLAG